MANILLISYDNGSHIPFFPQNLFYLYQALRKHQHTVGVWFQDIHHGKGPDLTRLLNGNRPVLNDASEAHTCRTLITPKLLADVDSLKRLQAESAAELDALLPAILDRAFNGEL